MTKSLQEINPNFGVKLISSGASKNQYIRFVSLELNKTPVIVAVSSTKLTNRTFVKILLKAKNTPIGIQLFAKDTDIKRNDRIQISYLTLNQVSNKTVSQYINKNLGYPFNTNIIKRVSLFSYKEENMQLVEYILPEILKFL